MPLIIPTLALLGVAAPNLPSVAPSPMGAHIADRWVLARDRILAAKENEAYLMESRTGEVLRVLRGHQEPVQTVAIHPRGARALTSSFVIENETFTPSRDTSIRLWDLKTGRQILRLENAAFGRYSAKGDRFLTVANNVAGRPTFPSIGDSVIRVYRAGDAREICAASVPEFDFGLGRAQFARGDAVIVALTFNDLRVFDSRDGRLLFTLAVEGERPVGIDISRSGDKVLAYTSNGCTVWSLKTGALLGRVREPTREAANDNGPPSAVFCRDERRVALIVRGGATIFRIEGGVTNALCSLPDPSPAWCGVPTPICCSSSGPLRRTTRMVRA